MMASAPFELPMVYQDISGNYHPLLATYETTDAKTWTYTIVEGMTWSDSTPLPQKTSSSLCGTAMKTAGPTSSPRLWMTRPPGKI